MASRRRRLDPVGPFGNPDGSRADIENLISEFVDFGGNPAYGHLATRANDSMVRVIVGKLGAGKTVYLRRLQDFQAHQDSVYADTPQQSLPKTEVIVKACQWFSDSVLVEKWMQIWERAIMRSLASHVLRHPELRQQVDDEQAAEIEQSYGRLLEDFRRPRSIYSEVRDIINQRQTAYQLSTYLDDPLWDDLEDVLGEVIARCKPIYFYLDAVDEEFSHAPMYWLKCQEGLFYQVMRLLRDHRLGGRLHVVVCIRDIVMSSVYRSEHAPRYYNEPHIRVLNWDRDSLLYLLGQKLARLPPSLLMRRPASGAPTIGDWLGIDVQWPGPDGDGPVEDYLLSHTRLIPRDIISLGNELSEEVLRQKQAGRDGLPPAALQAVVQRCAKRFGDSQLAQCANQISSDLMPKNAALHDYSELFTSTQAYISGVQEDVRSFVRLIGVDRFSRGDLVALQEVADLHFEEATNLASVLWQNGLLGYVDDAGRRRFYSLGDVEEFHLPPEVGTYVLHPCLVHAVGGIRHVGEDSAGAGDARRTRPLTSPERSDLLEAPGTAPRSGGNQALLAPGPAEVRNRQVSGLPSGLVTLLFSDIEGSTRLVKALRDRYWQVLAEHRRLVRAAVAGYAGYEVDAQGDAFFVAFADAKQAVLCALEVQRALAGHQWPAGAPVRVRIGIHTGHAVPAEGAYTGLAVHRAARICAAARGGQVLLSQATQTIVEDEEEELGFTLVDLGEHRLKDLDRPVRLFQLAAPGLEPPVPAGLSGLGEPSGAMARDETMTGGLEAGGVHRFRPRRLTLAPNSRTRASRSGGGMRIGVVFPQTELGGDPGAVCAYAQGAEELGFTHVLAYDHIVGADPVVHTGWNGPYNVQTTFHEPMVLYGYLAAVTSMELVTGIIILPQRQTVLVAKQAAEVDLLTGGKFRLGVGIGWNRVEYEALGQDFGTRGKRLEEQITLLRRLWTEQTVTFSGTFDQITGAGLAPMPVQRPIPVWVGAQSPPAYRRAGRLADGWFPQMAPGPQLEEARRIVMEAAVEAGRDPASLGMEGRLSWQEDQDELAAAMRRWQDAGATHLSVNTMGAGLKTVEAHLAALATVAEAAKTINS